MRSLISNTYYFFDLDHDLSIHIASESAKILNEKGWDMVLWQI